MAPRKRAKRPTKRASSAARRTARKPPKTKAKARSKPARRTAAPKAARKAKPARKPASSARRAARKTSPAATARPKTAQKKEMRPAKKPATTAFRPASRPSQVERARKQLPDAERLMAEERENAAADDRTLRAARSGGRELTQDLVRHTESGPGLTGGDLDARWQDAYAVGDEAPGGDNPTPDQDRVDDIGKALGVVYDDNEELEGAEKIAERDRHRWELDPASSDDWPHDKDR